MTEPQTRRPAWRPFVHAGRVLILVAIALIIHLAATLHAPVDDGPSPTVDVAIVQKLFPTAAKIDDSGVLLDEMGQSVGRVVQTSPAGDKAIGFSGPTNVLIGFSPEEKIVGLEILSSRDTREHVREIERHATFLHSLDGLTRDEVLSKTDFDAVSGATLTSLAMIEAIQRRLGGVQKSLKFPDLPELKVVRKLFPDAETLEVDVAYPALLHVKDAAGTSLGKLLRTSPAADNLVGYQGPTDMLVGLDADEKVIGLALSRSYDNEPYVDYVRTDDYFLGLLNGQSIAELSAIDNETLQIEGVSGATMTSQAAATGIYEAVDELVRARQEEEFIEAKVPWIYRLPLPQLRERDYKTIAVVIVGVLLAFSPWRGNPWARIPFQILVFVYLGFANGDFVSQALLVGWAQNGVPWKSAFGLVLLVGAALALPIFTRTNVYCSHLCPHGVVQQWTKRRIKWQWKPSKQLLPWLKAIPSVLLAWVVLVAAARWSFSLVDIEPFDAYVWHIAGWGTIAVAVVGLIASLFTPMAYCRFGCPTGALLDYVRYNGKSEFWTRRDWVAVGLLALGAVALLF
ncbi:FMN-binding protein [Blastopirellula sp. JC732]|uniref:FMN-binding protein n=1 Tax=Blastopirellula sediminis TaxID=2894196 RepID=A0A9X1SG71_9BACT|nr:FMN-binding protein [Blastopirellula sediminis]MCC9607624.1 FMN-binding protein [Blastopirellula sediminis]MCC9629083.1 FMN-binding protein [Blastopirellula sediminis]